MSATALQVSKQITMAEFLSAAVVDPILDRLDATVRRLSGDPDAPVRTTLEYLRDDQPALVHEANAVRIVSEPAA